MPALNTLRYGIFVLVAAMIFAFSNVRAEPQPLRLAITDLEGLEQLQREFGAFRDLLVEKTGLDIDFFPVPNRTAAVEAMRAKKLELALTGPAEYVVFKSRTDARPVLGFSRPDYFASLVVTAQSGINSVRDLRGKTVALGPIGSTSKHLAPMQILKDNGLIPGVDVKLTYTSIEIGWEALKRGDVAAFGTTNDKFLKLRDTEKTLEPGAFKVIARGPDLPNDILLARPDIDSAILNRISSALLRDSEAFANTILKGEDNQKYRGMTFIEHVKDSDYDYVRQMYVTAGYRKLTQFVGN